MLTEYNSSDKITNLQPLWMLPRHSPKDYITTELKAKRLMIQFWSHGSISHISMHLMVVALLEDNYLVSLHLLAWENRI